MEESGGGVQESGGSHAPGCGIRVWAYVAGVMLEID